jgi:hypothetical protein
LAAIVAFAFFRTDSDISEGCPDTGASTFVPTVVVVVIGDGWPDGADWRVIVFEDSAFSSEVLADPGGLRRRWFFSFCGNSR